MNAIKKTKTNLFSMRFYSPFKLLSAITNVTGGTKASSSRRRRADHLIFDEYSSPISKYAISTEAKRDPESSIVARSQGTLLHHDIDGSACEI